MKILVCGAGGFIGGHLVERLIKDGKQVKAVDIKKTYDWFQLHKDAENISLDLRDSNNCLLFFIKCLHL